MSLRVDGLALSRELERFPGTLFSICLALLAVSLVALHSASLTPDGGSLGYAARQAGWAVAGLAGFFVCSQLPYDRLGRRAWLFMGAGLVALALVLVVGTKVNGARSWFALGPVRLQPSEFVKYALVLLLARTVARRGPGIATWTGLGEAALITGVPIGLVLLQPDLGTALTYLPILGAIVFAAGARLWHLGLVALAGLSTLPIAWLFFLKDYQKLRIISFVDSSEHALGGAYQVTQSVIAVGSGGFFGRGLGQGTQGPLGFLPERHTDFVFAVVCEDFGLIGGLVVLGLYGQLIASLLEIVRTTRDPEGRLIVVGVAAVTLMHVVINVGMVLGVMPVTGLPLPLVSYGGSSLVATLCGFGLCASVARHRTKVFVPGAGDEAGATLGRLPVLAGRR